MGAADFKELIPEFYSGNGEFVVHNGVRIYLLITNFVKFICCWRIILLLKKKEKEKDPTKTKTAKSAYNMATRKRLMDTATL